MKQILFSLFIISLLVSCKDVKTCPVCEGIGSVSTTGGTFQCTACKGNGEVPSEKYDQIKAIWTNIKNNRGGELNVRGMQDQAQCPMCSGTGVFSALGSSKTCSECSGSGYTSVSRAAELKQSLQQLDQMTGGGGFIGTNISDGSDRPSNNVSGGHSTSDRSCHNCHGTGHCQHCKGIGVVDYDDPYSLDSGAMTCPICKGSKRCNVCNGSGHI